MAAQRSGSVGGGQICARFDQNKERLTIGDRIESSRERRICCVRKYLRQCSSWRATFQHNQVSAMRNSTRWRSRQLKAHPERVNAANRDHASSASRLELPIEFFERLLDALPLLKHSSNRSPTLAKRSSAFPMWIAGVKGLGGLRSIRAASIPARHRRRAERMEQKWSCLRRSAGDRNKLCPCRAWTPSAE